MSDLSSTLPSPNSDISVLIPLLLSQLSDIDTAVILTHLPRLYERLEHLRSAFNPSVRHCIAIKSNPQIHLLNIIVEQGFGLEAASMEEVEFALEAACPPEKIVFDSPVKTRQEIAKVSQLPNLLVNVNTLAELERFPRQTQCMIGIRINPLTHIGSPDLFSVSLNESKFGVPISERESIIQAALDYPVRALHMHSGSQMRDLKAQGRALKALGELALDINQALAHAGLDRRIECLDIGGGLPSESLSQQSKMKEYARLVHSLKVLESFTLVTEFGQWLNTECALALSRVEYVIQGEPSKLFIHLGADMFTRDAYTQARAFPLSLWDAQGLALDTHSLQAYDIAGPLCFAGDYVARHTRLPVAQEGHWLCIDHCGANTYALWSRHCSRTVPAQWAWDGTQIQQWRSRQAVRF